MENTGAASAKPLGLKHGYSTIHPEKWSHLQSKCTTNKGNCKNKICLHVKPQSYYKGPKIFNCLPREVRNLTGCSVDKFKSWLDEILSQLLDEPSVPGWKKHCRAATTQYWTRCTQNTQMQVLGAAVEHHNCEALTK